MATRKAKNGKTIEMTSAEAIVFDRHWNPGYSYERSKRRLFLMGYAACESDRKRERLFTESEVRAMALSAIKLIQRDLPQSPEHVGRAGGAIAKALFDAGIVLDPA